MADLVIHDEWQLPAWTESVGPGWAALLARLHQQLFALAPDYRIEKCERGLGGLRICVADRFDDQGDFDGQWADLATQLTDSTETASERTCELCGGAGRPRFRGGGGEVWITALCDGCASDLTRRAIPGASPLPPGRVR
ncbi:hypothetical protein RM844_24670 [Streptomyces sp. DSM 44915]|uniref:TraR/DksA family transcriptional regulator n=1 Tax=Streptomyces chisholmiae TaxID=3075540 RepID=A0ABU2JY74_9ACTN|nr:hypothetical protein [Streptomyces sp. DSM 44915]MDT0269479.1 hypothetical protein [Streptomyces sp. DSM 44915]